MKTDLKSFLSISGHFFFHGVGTFEEKFFKAIKAVELDETDRVGLIAELEGIVQSPRSDLEMKAFWDQLDAGVGFDEPAMVRWWLTALLEALRNTR
jgi:hypothetical protein